MIKQLEKKLEKKEEKQNILIAENKNKDDIIKILHERVSQLENKVEIYLKAFQDLGYFEHSVELDDQEETNVDELYVHQEDTLVSDDLLKNGKKTKDDETKTNEVDEDEDIMINDQRNCSPSLSENNKVSKNKTNDINKIIKMSKNEQQKVKSNKRRKRYY